MTSAGGRANIGLFFPAAINARSRGRQVRVMLLPVVACRRSSATPPHP
jgi:hypothetical protein